MSGAVCGLVNDAGHAGIGLWMFNMYNKVRRGVVGLEIGDMNECRWVREYVISLSSVIVGFDVWQQ
jgi:hypothetical protein